MGLNPFKDVSDALAGKTKKKPAAKTTAKAMPSKPPPGWSIVNGQWIRTADANARAKTTRNAPAKAKAKGKSQKDF